MKRMAFVIIAAVLACVLVGVLCLAGCTDNSTPSAISDKFENLAAEGEFSSSGGKQGDSAVYSFGREITFNALVLKEKGSKITKFRVYADDSTEPFYGSDFVEGYHYGSFEPVTASSVRIEVEESDGGWKLKGLEAYDIGGTAENFRVMGYVTAQSVYAGGSLRKEGADYNLNKATEVNYISGVYFDSKGDLYYRLEDGDKVTNDEGASIVPAGLNYLKSAVGNDVKVVVTVLGNINEGTGENYTTEERHNLAMTGAAAENLTKNLLALIEHYDLDGISFDYEYPSQSKSFEVFTDYLKALDKALPEGKLLTAAISEWQIGTATFVPENLNVLDSIEVMAYDMFDDRGNHSSFYNSCFKLLQSLEKKGIDLAKINLGLPFYSRPSDGDNFWGDYGAAAESMDRWDNGTDFFGTYTDLDGNKGSEYNYLNGVGITYDKTCYAIDCGAGGVMIWHVGTDYISSDAAKAEEYSLMGAIEKAILSRTA